MATQRTGVFVEVRGKFFVHDDFFFCIVPREKFRLLKQKNDEPKIPRRNFLCTTIFFSAMKFSASFAEKKFVSKNKKNDDTKILRGKFRIVVVI
jgi:hypothetical protein